MDNDFASEFTINQKHKASSLSWPSHPIHAHPNALLQTITPFPCVSLCPGNQACKALQSWGEPLTSKIRKPVSKWFSPPSPPSLKVQLLWLLGRHCYGIQWSAASGSDQLNNTPLLWLLSFPLSLSYPSLLLHRITCTNKTAAYKPAASDSLPGKPKLRHYISVFWVVIIHRPHKSSNYQKKYHFTINFHHLFKFQKSFPILWTNDDYPEKKQNKKTNTTTSLHILNQRIHFFKLPSSFTVLREIFVLYIHLKSQDTPENLR